MIISLVKLQLHQAITSSLQTRPIIKVPILISKCIVLLSSTGFQGPPAAPHFKPCCPSIIRPWESNHTSRCLWRILISNPPLEKVSFHLVAYSMYAFIAELYCKSCEGGVRVPVCVCLRVCVCVAALQHIRRLAVTHDTRGP